MSSPPIMAVCRPVRKRRFSSHSARKTWLHLETLTLTPRYQVYLSERLWLSDKKRTFYALNALKEHPVLSAAKTSFQSTRTRSESTRETPHFFSGACDASKQLTMNTASSHLWISTCITNVPLTVKVPKSLDENADLAEIAHNYQTQTDDGNAWTCHQCRESPWDIDIVRHFYPFIFFETTVSYIIFYTGNRLASSPCHISFPLFTPSSTQNAIIQSIPPQGISHQIRFQIVPPCNMGHPPVARRHRPHETPAILGKGSDSGFGHG